MIGEKIVLGVSLKTNRPFTSKGSEIPIKQVRSVNANDKQKGAPVRIGGQMKCDQDACLLTIFLSFSHLLLLSFSRLFPPPLPVGIFFSLPQVRTCPRYLPNLRCQPKYTRKPWTLGEADLE